MADNNGLKIKLSKPAQIIIWIISLAFAAGMIWSQVQANSLEIDKTNICVTEVKKTVNKHSVSIGKIEEFKKATLENQKVQTKRYDSIMEGIGDIREKLPK